MVSSTALKVIVTGAIFALTVLASLLPYKFRASKRFLSVCNVFAGGIFLGAGLCHLLADSAEQFNEYYEEHDEHHHDDHDGHDDPEPTPTPSLTHGGDDEDEHFPWPYAMMGIGFLTTMFVEILAHKLIHSEPKKDQHVADSINNSQTEPFLPAQGDYLADSSVDQENLPAKNTGLTPENSFYSNFGSDHHGHSHNNHHNDNHHGHSHENHHGHDHGHHDHGDDHGHSHMPLNTEGQSLIMAFALFLALSFHSIVEGISLGSASDDSVKSIMIAILAHKGLESFSLGTSLINSNATIIKYVLFCLVFACMTPRGVLIGALVEASTEGIVSAFITGFAAGTFTYVAVVEVLIPEFKKQKDLFLKAVAASAGFAGMAVIALWV